MAPRTAKPNTRTNATSMRRMLREAPKLAALQNRRLNRLIDKSKVGELTPREAKELGELVETVDRQSFLTLANSLMKYIAVHGHLPPKRGRRAKGTA